jgi:hypothetical protein
MVRTLFPLPRTKQVTVTVRNFGQTFPFKLHTRPLALGSLATVQYYWMDSSQLRTLSSNASAANYFHCLAHWWASMQARALHHDLEQQIHYVMAQTYPEVCRCKSLQDIYRDAFLNTKPDKERILSLPEEDRQRINEIVHLRDRFRVKAELDAVLGRFRPPDGVLPVLQEAFRRWAGRGVTLWRQQGSEGLKQFLGEVAYWLDKYRKKGGHRWVRHFINLFAYEAKVSFYTCYANAWVDIIPCLQKDHGLDPVSERFLRLWHHQNQAIEIPHGQTAGGIYYPTHVRYDFFLAGADGQVIPKRICLPTERIGPTHIPDVFSGQILSLHPLSGFFMKDSALCAVAGAFFASERYEQILAHGLAEYWDLVGAILTAARLYRRASDEEARNRGVRRRSQDTTDAADIADNASEAQLLEDFAADQNVTCPDCHHPVRLVHYHPAGQSDSVRVDYSCSRCARPILATFSALTLMEWLRSAD